MAFQNAVSLDEVRRFSLPLTRRTLVTVLRLFLYSRQKRDVSFNPNASGVGANAGKRWIARKPLA